MTVRIFVASALILCFGFCAAFNATSLWKRSIRREHYPSSIPVLGGILGAAGLWLLPLPVLSRFAWMALVLDYGCLPYTFSASLYLAQEAYMHSRRFLIMQLQGQHPDGTESALTLYRNGDCILKQKGMPPPIMQLSLTGEWRKEANMLVLEIAGNKVQYELNGTLVGYRWLPTSDAGVFQGISLQLVSRVL